jgi:large subunit ribosomal protein L11|uniref:Large ribosomal subunit protein uL11c n=2 Tax=Cyanidioschyzon merolae TaxID=45157 RepID=RK11_CYAM1|nr:ribosomal protein L11 [Cyanidioschyzon merolae strain 10D]Q85G12.1 RecName: Full=Large ribosomal subunit protein uL11c; AltName: Full=50S ribosomal protein L11, chloroplastic [Cyanidioschyzon merolae strain 10D]QFV16976.1 50S ribosomal protein L11 [Cyanidioschyzon merolae]QFV17154.1 50S ribosomal protein L11 [Cyanidioschyzon merolae]BAC76179.1 50S ribosomal protein L11 [Cyanidioschyzon merolae strain 10D]
MGKKVLAVVKLALPAGKATPAPPVGPALGQYGVNLVMFTKEYNAKTADQIGLIIPAQITIYEDKSYSFILKTPPASVLLKRAAQIEKGSNNGTIVASITQEQLQQIALTKLPDLNTKDVKKAMSIISGTAANMGIQIL